MLFDYVAMADNFSWQSLCQKTLNVVHSGMSDRSDILEGYRRDIYLLIKGIWESISVR